MNARALASLLDAMDRASIDTLLIRSTANLRYLTGMRCDDGWLAVRHDGPVFFTNSLYIEDVRSRLGDRLEVVDYGEDLSRALAARGGKFWGARTGYEAARISCDECRRISQALNGVEMTPVTDMVESIRTIKTPSEIESVTRAQRIAERVFEEILAEIREGMTERELAYEIEYRLRKHGGERVSFDTIVASGPNASRPHAVPSDREFANGDLIVIDMGTVVDGYASDMTRTVSLGAPPRELRDMYDVVLDAQQAAIDRIEAGMACSEADRIARDLIGNAGYGERFVHSLGHGVGLEVHEKPRLSARSKDHLAAGMIVTVEPGIYLPGAGGVRIEDMAAVGEDGCTNLTLAPKTFMEL